MERIFMGSFVIGYLSEIGHNNFHYPSYTKVCMDEEHARASVQKLHWAPGNNRNLSPYKVKRNLIKPLTIDKLYVNVVVNNDNEYIVVWFEKEK